MQKFPVRVTREIAVFSVVLLDLDVDVSLLVSH